MNEVPKQIRIQLLVEETQRWKNTRFLWEARYRAYKRVRNAEALKEVDQQLILVEGGIAELETMLKEIEAEALPAPQSGTQ